MIVHENPIGITAESLENNSEIERFIEGVRKNPDTALSSINNMKIKLEMNKKAVEDKILEIEQELSKVSNPSILAILQEIKTASSEKELELTNNKLQELENTILNEIEGMLREDGELIKTLGTDYGNRG